MHNVSAPIVFNEPLVMLPLGSTSNVGEEEGEADEENDEEEEEDTMDEGGERLGEDVGLIGHTHQSKALRRKKPLLVGTSCKIILDLMVDNPQDTTAVFCEKRGKNKKLYSVYTPKDTIAISSEDNDDQEMVTRLRSNPPSPMALVCLICVKPKVLTMEEVNGRKAREVKHRL